MTHIGRRGPADRRRPLFGLRRKPGRLALTAFRLPLTAYRHDVGWLFGRMFLQFTHIGRSSGKRYDAVAMVLRYDEATREAVSALYQVIQFLGGKRPIQEVSVDSWSMRSPVGVIWIR